jgi:solute carrier family 9 (sodium/hydrogen exchanger), member 6/7
MSRRTQLTTKYLFQVLAQLSENFIFIYLGLTLFTDTNLQFKPLFILVTVFGICVARWTAVFPLSKVINSIIRYRAKRRGVEVAEELPYNYQAMLFWAGLRGAVGVALAAGLGDVAPALALKATVLVVVVLTVIIFGGTTARMLEILGIRTGVVEEIDSDDEFDIEAVNGASYYKRAGTGIGADPRRNGSAVPLDDVGRNSSRRGFASGNASPDKRPTSLNRRGSAGSPNGHSNEGEQDLLARIDTLSDENDDSDSSDLPPPAKRPPKRKPEIQSEGGDLGGSSSYPTSGTTNHYEVPHISASSAISSLINGTTEDHAAWFRQLDEGFIKPKLLLDGGKGPHGGPSGA